MATKCENCSCCIDDESFMYHIYNNCDYAYVNLSTLELHPYQCNRCFVHLPTNDSLKFHYQTCSATNKYMCKWCFCCFPTYDKLVEHELTVYCSKSRGIPYCFYCGQQFYDIQQWRSHIHGCEIDHSHSDTHICDISVFEDDTTIYTT